MSKTKSKLQIQKEMQERKVKMALRALALDNKNKNNRQQAQTRQSRKPVEELGQYLAAPLNDRMRLRNAAEFCTRTYNLERQIEELIAHLYVRYPAPRFLLGALLSDKGRALLGFPARQRGKKQAAFDQWERNVFLAAAQGRSVADLLARTLTRKEAHWFLRAPDFFTSQQNLIWAKLAAAGVHLPLANLLVPRLIEGQNMERLEQREAEFLQFFAALPKDAKFEHLMEVMDFAVHMIQEPNFRYKGRTLGSMRKLAQDWHRQNQYGSRGALVHWPRQFEPWEYISRFEHVRAIELNTSWALHAESARQRHCVFTYQRGCMAGHSRIVAFTWMVEHADGTLVEDNRLTVSVTMSRREVDQALGRCNRKLNEGEKKIVRLWASQNGLKISPYVWW